jgi:hypothetical protein
MAVIIILLSIVGLLFFTLFFAWKKIEKSIMNSFQYQDYIHRQSRKWY